MEYCLALHLSHARLFLEALRDYRSDWVCNAGAQTVVDRDESGSALLRFARLGVIGVSLRDLKDAIVSRMCYCLMVAINR